MNNKLKEFKKIDTHFHIGKYVSSSVNDSYEDLEVKAAKDLDFKKIIVIHTGLFFDLDYGTGKTLEFLKNNKDFAYGLLVYNPNHIERSLNIIGKHFGKDNIVGIKMHPEDHKCFSTDSKYEGLWKIASDKNIPILSHTWNPNVPSKSQKYADALLFEKVIQKYPGLKIILGHAGAKDYYYPEVIKMLKRNKDKDIYIDIAGDILYRDMLELFVKELGSKKILFGTDTPWMDSLLTVSYVNNSAISREDKENIFYNNAMRFFDLTD